VQNTRIINLDLHSKNTHYYEGSDSEDVDAADRRPFFPVEYIDYCKQSNLLCIFNKNNNIEYLDGCGYNAMGLEFHTFDAEFQNEIIQHIICYMPRCKILRTFIFTETIQRIFADGLHLPRSLRVLDCYVTGMVYVA